MLTNVNCTQVRLEVILWGLWGVNWLNKHWLVKSVLTQWWNIWKKETNKTDKIHQIYWLPHYNTCIHTIFLTWDISVFIDDTALFTRSIGTTSCWSCCLNVLKKPSMLSAVAILLDLFAASCRVGKSSVCEALNSVFSAVAVFCWSLAVAPGVSSDDNFPSVNTSGATIGSGWHRKISKPNRGGTLIERDTSTQYFQPYDLFWQITLIDMYHFHWNLCSAWKHLLLQCVKFIPAKFCLLSRASPWNRLSNLLSATLIAIVPSSRLLIFTNVLCLFVRLKEIYRIIANKRTVRLWNC